jgi:peroxiredoxin
MATGSGTMTIVERLARFAGRASVLARRGETFPAFELAALDGSCVLLENYRGRKNLVLVFAGDAPAHGPVAQLVESLDARKDELVSEAAQVLVIIASRPGVSPERGPRAFPTLLDHRARIHGSVGAMANGAPAPAVFVTDRFREIYTAYGSSHGSALPDAKDIMDWLMFINIQCPECGASEWRNLMAGRIL